MGGKINRAEVWTGTEYWAGKERGKSGILQKVGKAGGGVLSLFFLRGDLYWLLVFMSTFIYVARQPVPPTPTQK